MGHLVTNMTHWSLFNADGTSLKGVVKMGLS